MPQNQTVTLAKIPVAYFLVVNNLFTFHQSHMENDIKERFDKMEKALGSKQKDIWDKLPIFTGLLIPITIAVLGWYFTNEHNKSQLEIQKLNNENQFQVALVNSNVGQSELIKDFMQHLTSKDTAARNIAIEAILYAAPTPGKKIVEVLSRSNDKQTRAFAIDALSSKRLDLIENLFSDQKQVRLVAANEIISNWASDNQMLVELLNRTEKCLGNDGSSANCNDGVYNAFALLPSFSKQLLVSQKQRIAALSNGVPASNQKTRKLAEDVLQKI